MRRLLKSSFLVTACLVCAACWSLLDTQIATAHYRIDDKRWWFRGYTALHQDGSAPSDPINIFFYRGGRVTLDRVDNHLRAHTGLDRKMECATRPLGVCIRKKECDGGDQWLTFVNYSRDRRPGAPPKDIDLADRVRETSCGSRFHMRMWDDKEHDEHTVHHRIKDWVAANIHFDTEVGGRDQVLGEFDSYERAFVRRMGVHCVIPHWRVLPGSMMARKGVKRYSDGYVSLVSMAHKDQPGACPN